MIDFEQMRREIAALGLNLYDVALCTADGIRSAKFQPCNACNDSYSIGKAFVMTAVGLLYDEGLIRVEERLSAYLGELVPAGTEPGWRVATVEQALTHRLGFGSDFLDIDVDDVAAYGTDDYLSLVFAHPLDYPPGTHYTYTDAAFYLLSRVVERVAGKPTDLFLQERLFGPLGFGEIAWSRDPQGHIIGASGLYARAEDIVKLGWLYLRGGEYRGKRLLSARWVRHVLEREYEFRMLMPGGLMGKGGMYGQAVVFSREGGFAAAWHAYETAQGVNRLIQYFDALGAG